MKIQTPLRMANIKKKEVAIPGVNEDAETSALLRYWVGVLWGGHQETHGRQG